MRPARRQANLKSAEAPTGVTLRALVVGLVLTPLNVVFIVHATMLQGGFRFTGRHSLFVNTVAVLFALSLLNRWLRRRRSRLTFGSGEMLTIYLMLGVSTGLISSAFDLGGSLAGTITYPFWFATKENAWRELLWPNLPTWLTVQDRSALEELLRGRRQPIHLVCFPGVADPRPLVCRLRGGHDVGLSLPELHRAAPLGG